MAYPLQCNFLPYQQRANDFSIAVPCCVGTNSEEEIYPACNDTNQCADLAGHCNILKERALG